MEDEGSFIAALVLVLWVPTTILLFALFRPGRAAALCFLLGTLLLPELQAFKLPLFPDLDKRTLTSLCVLGGCLFTCRRRLSIAMKSGVKYFFALLFFGDLLRALLNGDTLFYGPTVVPPIKPHTGLTFIMEDILNLGVPFFVGAALYRKPQELADFVKVFVYGGILYTLFAVVEIRLSPQLHNWVYGYHHIDWLQVLRGGGYRPTAFFAHGLAAATFLATATVLALAWFRARVILALPLAVWMMLVLVLSNSLGALISALALAPIVLLGFPRSQARVARWIAVIVLLYPALRVLDLFPVQAVVDQAAQINEARADSLAFRFTQDDAILQKTLLRPVFGWGGFARGRIFDPETGEDISVTDGAWIIEVMSRGIWGFVAFFGILLWPLFRAKKRLRFVGHYPTRALMGGIAMAIALNAVDLLVNALFTFLPFLLAGVLTGALDELALMPRAVASRAGAMRRIVGTDLRNPSRRPIPL